MYIFREQPVPNGARAVDIAATDHTCATGCVGIWVGDGNLTLVATLWSGDATVTFANVPDGTWIPGNFKTIVKSGTDAADMVEMYLDRNP
jgi:hypothetical protein